MSGQKSSSAGVTVDVEDPDILATDFSRSGADDDASEEEQSSGADRGANGSAPNGEGRQVDWEARYRAERSRKLEAQRRARDVEVRHAAFVAGTEAKLTDIQRQTAGLTAIEVGKRVTEFGRAVSVAEQALTAAFESGDARRITDAQKEMNAAQHALERAQADAEAYKGEFKKQTEPVKIPVPAQERRADPEVLELRQSWESQNPWFTSQNPTSYQRLAKKAAIEESAAIHAAGIPPNDPEHWRLVTERVRAREPKAFEDDGSGGERERQEDPPRRQTQQRQQGGAQVHAPASARTANQGRSTQPAGYRHEFSDYEKASWAAIGLDVNKPEDRKRAEAQIERARRRRA